MKPHIPWWVELLKDCRKWLDEDGVPPDFWTPAYKEFRDGLDRAIKTNDFPR